MPKKIFAEICMYMLAALIMIYCCMLVEKGEVVKGGIVQAVSRCVNVIVPSLFAFMAVSSVIVNSGLYYYISRPFYFLSKYVMGIPPQLFFVFLLGNIAGYPMGIKLLTDMVKRRQISRRTAEIMSISCCGGGPAFFSGTVGLAIFGSVRVGIIIFISSAAANFIMAVFTGHIFKPQADRCDKKIYLTSQIFTNSIISAGKSLFTVCIMILFFSTIMSALDIVGFFGFIQEVTGCSDNGTVLLKSALEISSITQISGQPYGLLPFFAGVCSFGGVCVIIQIFALCGGEFRLKYFLLTRPVNVGLSVLICAVLEKFMLPNSVAAISEGVKVFVNFNNFIPSICLILMILLLNLKKRLVFSNGMCYNEK